MLTVSIAKSWGSVLTLLFSVVVAEQCNKLPQCVKALKQAKKRPNIASLQRRLCLKEEDRKGLCSTMKKIKTKSHSSGDEIMYSLYLYITCVTIAYV